ncbi:MAG: hypothetical protein AB7S26_31745 [Sandaracinaceae bacterium]
MHAKCDRCGASAPKVETGKPTLCELCEPLTQSQEEARAEAISFDAMSLEALIQNAGPRIADRGSRTSLEIVGGPHPFLGAPVVPAQRRSYGLWIALGLMAGVVLTLSSTALIQASSRAPTVASDAAPDALASIAHKVAGAQERDVNVGRDEEPTPDAVSGAAETAEPEVAPEPAATPARPTTPRPAPATPGAGTTTPSRPTGLRAAPNRDEVAAAMARTQLAVERCVDIEMYGARVVVRVDFRGSDGEVAHAQVTDGDVAPEIRSCIARAARDAEVGPFARERFTVVYPYVL